MISSHIGFYSLLLGFVISVSLLFYSIFCFKKNNQNINQNIFSFLFLQFFTVDKGFLLLQCLDEMQTGRSSAAQALKRRETGGYAVPGALYLDALSVFASVTATFIKTPADNGVLVHCLYLRELLDDGVLSALIWQDTRDMIADGLTKGAVDRQGLHDVMDGVVKVLHECKPWQPKHLVSKGPR